MEDRRHLDSPHLRAEGVAEGRADAAHPPRRGRGGVHQRRAGREGRRVHDGLRRGAAERRRPQGAQGRDEHDRGPLPADRRRPVHRRRAGGGGGAKVVSPRVRGTTDESALANLTS